MNEALLFSFFSVLLYIINLNCTNFVYHYLRPYNRESTASRPICEVKHVLAQIVVRWVTTREV